MLLLLYEQLQNIHLIFLTPTEIGKTLEDSLNILESFYVALGGGGQQNYILSIRQTTYNGSANVTATFGVS
jgi:hypothetical protein